MKQCGIILIHLNLKAVDTGEEMKYDQSRRRHDTLTPEMLFVFLFFIYLLENYYYYLAR